MKAALIESPKRLTITELPDPACAPDEVLLRVFRSSICNATDVHIWEGTFPRDACPPYPHVLGHECAGEIVEIGKDIKGWEVGDRVAYWVKMTGAFGQYNAVKINKLAATKLGSGITDDEAPVMEIVGGTLRCMYNNGMQIGDRVLIFGLGPTGLLLLQETKLFGADFVAAFDIFPNRLAKAVQYGADLAYNLSGKTQEEAYAELRETVGKVDFIIDAMGNHRWKGGNAINLGLSLLRRGGIYQIWGHPTEDQPVNTRWVSNENYTMRGFEPGWDISRKMIQFGEKLVAAGKIDVKGLITHRLPLAELQKGLILCRDHMDEAIKVVIDPQS
jgi:2-desacetyl-2-hydroxyethyl bacteriochlorophyllide A dehydrogenase